VRPSLTHRLRAHLAALLTGLLMLVSAAPCVALAAPSAQPQLAAPADPCRAHHSGAVTPCACPQLSCQQAAPASAGFGAPAAFASPATFTEASAAGHGRTEPPPLPPPRPLL
jgi:hypothetical protein